MDTVTFLAKAWGLLIVISISSLLVNKKILKQVMKLVEDDTFMIVSGYLSLVIGILSLLFYNAWTQDWKVLITIFGWLAFIKGVIRLGFPQVTVNMVKKFEKDANSMNILIFTSLAAGAYLLYKGFNG